MKAYAGLTTDKPTSTEVLKDTILSYQAELGATKMKLFHARNALVLARTTLDQIKLNIAQVDLGGVIGILEKQES